MPKYLASRLHAEGAIMAFLVDKPVTSLYALSADAVCVPVRYGGCCLCPFSVISELSTAPKTRNLFVVSLRKHVLSCLTAAGRHPMAVYRFVGAAAPCVLVCVLRTWVFSKDRRSEFINAQTVFKAPNFAPFKGMRKLSLKQNMLVFSKA